MRNVDLRGWIYGQARARSSSGSHLIRHRLHCGVHLSCARKGSGGHGGQQQQQETAPRHQVQPLPRQIHRDPLSSHPGEVGLFLVTPISCGQQRASAVGRHSKGAAAGDPPRAPCTAGVMAGAAAAAAAPLLRKLLHVVRPASRRARAG